MGAVKRDIYIRERIWQNINLSTVEVVKGLLKNRSEYDLLWGLDKNTYNISKSYVYLNEIVEEVTCLYSYIDELIKSIGLNSKQEKLVKMYQYGYNEEDLALEFLVDQQNINKIITTICKKILKANKEKWLNEFVLWSKLKVKTEYKQCTRCKEFLSVENFGKKEDNKDNLENRCKKCESFRKKS